jgi:hypothetical protein
MYWIREEGSSVLVKGERIQEAISTLRNTLFTIFKKWAFLVLWGPGSFIPDLVYFLSKSVSEK